MILLGLLVFGWLVAFSDNISYIPYGSNKECGHC